MNTLCYRAYGLTIASEIPLSLPDGLCEPQDIDVNIYDEIPPSDLREHPQSHYGKVGGLCEILIYKGKDIFVKLHDRNRLSFIGNVIEGELLAACLRVRGLLAIHASCVALRGKAIAFVGCAGAGKSTLANAVLSKTKEAVLVCDDVLPIHVGSPLNMCIPAHPETKIWEDTANSLGFNYEELSPVPWAADKRKFRVQSFATHEVPLAKLYFIEVGSPIAASIKAASEKEAGVGLMHHSWAQPLLASRCHERELFEQCATVARSVPAVRLRRSTSINQLSTVVSVVLNDFAATSRSLK